MIRIAAQVQYTACQCLTNLLKRLDQACTPELLAQWDVLPHRREQGLAHPSWVEEFRVYQALWCLQLISDLYHATGPDPVKSQSGESWGGWGWSEAEIQKIKTYRSYLPDAFEVGSLLPASSDEIQCVSDSLRELGALCHSPVDEPVPEAHATNSTDKFDYVAPFFESLQTPNMPNGSVWSMQPFPENSEINTKWHRSARHASRGFISSFYRKEVFLRERTKNHGPPTPGLEKIREFHKLGLFIWDLWRMYCMGLMKPGRPGTPAPDGSVAEALSTREIFEELSRWCKLIS
jgi:hypothetical protein